MSAAVPAPPIRRRPGGWLRRMLVALLRQRRRLVLATVAIALSVGYLAGALNLLGRVGNGLDAIAASGAGRADLVVEGGIAYESPMEQVRRLVPSSAERVVAAVPGVAAVSPRIEDTAPIVGPDGTTLVRLGLTEQPIGANFPTDPRLSSYEFTAGGPPTTSGQVAIDERSADAGDVAVGDDVTVVGRAGAGTYEVSGIVRTGSGGLPKGSSLALLSTDEARVRFERPADDNTIDVLVDPGADPDEVADSIAALLPAGIEVVDGSTAAVHRQESVDRSFTLVRSLILGFAGLALVVGMVTVGNSLSLLYAERRRTFAGLRLMGARPRQLMTAALVEAGLLAVAASVLGAPLGLLLGKLIESSLGALNTSVPVAGPAVSWTALGWAVLIGTLATVVAAVLPAWRVCRVPPIEAVVDGGPPPQRTVRQSLLTVGVVSVVVGLVAALLVSRGEAGLRPGPLGLGAAAVVAVLGTLPLLLSGLVAGAVRVLPLRPHALRTIAARDVSRHRSRTAATAAALILATAVVAGLAVFLSSFTTSVDGQVRDLVAADLVVDSGTFTKGGLPDDLVQELVALPETAAGSGWQIGRGTVGTTPVRMTGFDLAAFPALLRPTWVGAEPGPLDATSVLVSRRLAEANGLGVGDPLSVLFTSGGVETFRVAGVYGSGDLLLGDAVLDRTVLTRQVPATTDIAALVALDPDDAATRAKVRELAAASGVDSVLAPESFVQHRAQVVHGFERVIEWMLLFTLVQALIGVVNTLLLSVGERRRELGLLRASGASRRQVLRMVLVEGISLAVVGTFVGLVVGLIGARLGVMSLASLGLTSFTVPVGSVVVVGFAAVMLGIAATVAPARWAAGVPSLEAVLDDGDLRSRPRRAQRPRLHRFGRAGFHWAGFHWSQQEPAAADAAAAAWTAAGTAAEAAGQAGSPDVPGAPLPVLLPPPFGAVRYPATGADLSTPLTPPPFRPPPFRPPPFSGVTPAPRLMPPPLAALPPAPVLAEPAVAPEPAVSPEPAVAPEPVVAPASPSHVGARRRARWSPAGTTRRRRSRSESAERWVTAGADPDAASERVPADAPAVDVPAAEPVAWTVDGPDLGVEAPDAFLPRPPRGIRFGVGRPAGTAASPPRPAAFAPGGGDVGAKRSTGGAPAGGAGAGGAGAGGAGAAESPVQESLRRAIGRLDPLSSMESADTLRLVSATLADGERVERLVAGRAKGIPCVVVRTERRLLVVADRPGRPIVESLHPLWTDVGTERGDDGAVCVVVSDGHRVMRLHGVRDAAEAELLARTDTTDPSYF